MEYIVSTENLTKKFGAFIAVDRLSIRIKRGEIYGFLGPNGAGKSTAIRMLCGLLEPTSGTGNILGYDLRRDTEKIKSRIGYMSQKFSLYEDLSVKENLDFFASIYNVPSADKKERMKEMLAMADLEDRENEIAANLSGGFKQRLALGCAIISRPAIVFLDEPTSGVSPTSRRMFFNIIQKLVQTGTTVMVTTHFMDEAERCNNIAFISAGKLMAMDTPMNLKKNTLRGFLVELDIPGAMEKIESISALPYVRECSLHGPLLHVLLNKEEDVVFLREYLGVEPKPIVPSLEDVFLALAKLQRAGVENA